jgi:hypothetical protein
MRRKYVVAGSMVVATIVGCSAAPGEPSGTSAQDLVVGGPPLHIVECAAEPSSSWWQYTAMNDPGALWFSAGDPWTDPSNNVWLPYAAFNAEGQVVDATWVAFNAEELFNCLNPYCEFGGFVPGGDGQVPGQSPTTSGTRYPTPNCTPSGCSPDDGPAPTPPICITSGEQQEVKNFFGAYGGFNPNLCTLPSKCPAEVYKPVNGGPISNPVGLL